MKINYEDSGAKLVEWTIKVVTQPGQDPHDLYNGVMREIKKVAGDSAMVQTMGHDKDHLPESFVSTPLFVRRIEEGNK